MGHRGAKHRRRGALHPTSRLPWTPKPARAAGTSSTLRLRPTTSIRFQARPRRPGDGAVPLQDGQDRSPVRARFAHRSVPLRLHRSQYRMSCFRRSRSQAVCVTHVIRVRSRMSSESVNRQPVRDVSTCFDRSNGRIHREKRPLDTTKAKAIPIPIQVTNEDVFLLKVQSLSAGVSQTSMQRFGILAQGQVTGHAHRIVKKWTRPAVRPRWTSLRLLQENGHPHSRGAWKSTAGAKGLPVHYRARL